MKHFARIVCVAVTALALSMAVFAREEVTTLLVTKDKIPADTLLDEPEKYFELKTVPVEQAPAVSLRSYAVIKGLRTKHDLAKGDLLRPCDLVNGDKASADLPSGMRAIAIPLHPEKLAGGFVLPGSKVDVIHVSRATPDKPSVAKTILQDVLVLAVDMSLPRPKEDEKVDLIQTVTLAVTPQDAAVVALAKETGELSLALRAPGDETKPVQPSAMKRSGQRWMVTLRLKDGAVDDVQRGGYGLISVEVPDESGQSTKVVVIQDVRILDFDGLPSRPNEATARRTITVSMAVEDAHRLGKGTESGIVARAELDGGYDIYTRVSFNPFGRNASNTFRYVSGQVKGSGRCR